MFLSKKNKIDASRYFSKKKEQLNVTRFHNNPDGYFSLGYSVHHELKRSKVLNFFQGKMARPRINNN